MDPPSTETVTGLPPHGSPAQIRGAGGGIAVVLPVSLRDDSTHGARVSLHTWSEADAWAKIQSVTAGANSKALVHGGTATDHLATIAGGLVNVG
jgi:hypothetical protein